METRYKMLTKTHPDRAEKLIEEAQKDVVDKWKTYEGLNANNPNEAKNN